MALFLPRRRLSRAVPVEKKKMAALKSEYGSKKGESVYYALEASKAKKFSSKKRRSAKKY